VSARLSSLSRRLVQVEQRLADKVSRERPATCICTARTVALRQKAFEEEMNRPCPAHGFRDLGQILRVVIVGGNGLPINEDGTQDDGSLCSRFDEVIATYESRRARHQADSRAKR
jgi:hypothetical protein